MNKKLIALGVAAALTAPLAAQAGVEVYGEARASLDFVTNNDNTAGEEDSAISLSSNKSRIGFRGDEDLGNGLSAMWQFEQQMEFDTGAANTSARDTFIGLGGGFGTVLAGHLSTPYKSSTNYMDVFRNTRGDYNAIMGSVNGSVEFDNRADNAIIYMTPDMNGFKASLAYILADINNDDDLPISTAGGDRDAYSLSGGYTNGPLFLTAAYEAMNAAGAGGDDATAWKIGGTFTITDATTVGAIWESIDLGGANNDRDAWLLNAKHKMGDTSLMASVAMADETGGTADTGATHFALGVGQALSANTDVYALYTVVSNDANASYGLFSNSDSFTGEDMSAFSVGINHKFSSK